MTGLMGQEHWAEASPIPGLSNRDTVVYGSACICFFALTRTDLKDKNTSDLSADLTKF